MTDAASSVGSLGPVRSIGTTSFATSFAFTGIDTAVEHAVVELIAVFVGPDGRPVAIPAEARAALEGSERA